MTLALAVDIGLTLLVPFLREISGAATGFGVLAASMVLAIMIRHDECRYIRDCSKRAASSSGGPPTSAMSRSCSHLVMEGQRSLSTRSRTSTRSSLGAHSAMRHSSRSRRANKLTLAMA